MFNFKYLVMALVGFFGLNNFALDLEIKNNCDNTTIVVATDAGDRKHHGIDKGQTKTLNFDASINRIVVNNFWMASEPCTIKVPASARKINLTLSKGELFKCNCAINAADK